MRESNCKGKTRLKPLHLSGDRWVICLGKLFHNFDVIFPHAVIPKTFHDVSDIFQIGL
jgi:hypothetical protein